MGSTSVRVPWGLLQTLHDAKTSGTSLADVIETALDRAGGAEAVRRALRAKDRHERAKARVARLRRLGHPSVVLSPGEQASLAEGVRLKVQNERARGARYRDRQSGTLVLGSEPLNASKRDDRSASSRALLGSRRSSG